MFVTATVVAVFAVAKIDVATANIICMSLVAYAMMKDHTSNDSE